MSQTDLTEISPKHMNRIFKNDLVLVKPILLWKKCKLWYLIQFAFLTLWITKFVLTNEKLSTQLLCLYICMVFLIKQYEGHCFFSAVKRTRHIYYFIYNSLVSASQLFNEYNFYYVLLVIPSLLYSYHIFIRFVIVIFFKIF